MEDHQERSRRVQQKNIGLVYIIVIIFITLGITSYFLFDNMNQVRFLESQKSVLIDRLGEELLLKQQLKKKNDSIIEYWNSYEPIPLNAEESPVR